MNQILQTLQLLQIPSEAWDQHSIAQGTLGYGSQRSTTELFETNTTKSVLAV